MLILDGNTHLLNKQTRTEYRDKLYILQIVLLSDIYIYIDR
jgi:hypothetical protein